MFSALRDLVAVLPPRARLIFALSLVAACVATLLALLYAGADLTPFWALLTGG